MDKSLKPEEKGINGFLLVDKPEGITSRAALNQTLNKLNTTKGGYEGTLDPFAGGLLIAGLGSACRFFRYFGSLRKRYRGVLQLGTETDTLDRDGRTVRETEIPELTGKDIENIEKAFTGSLHQVPPAFSALKKNGVRGYDLARRGSPVRFEMRDIHVYDFTVETSERGRITFSCTVSRGTYIRSMARDIAAHIGAAGHLAGLRRLSIGDFSAEDAVFPEHADVSDLIPAETALYWMRDVSLESRHARSLIHGQTVPFDSEEGLCRVACGGIFLGVGECRQGELRAQRLLPQTQPGDR